MKTVKATTDITPAKRLSNFKTDDCGMILESIRGRIEVFKVGEKRKGTHYGIRGDIDCMDALEARLLYESLGRLLGEPAFTGPMPENKHCLIDCIRLGYIPGRVNSK